MERAAFRRRHAPLPGRRRAAGQQRVPQQPPPGGVVGVVGVEEEPQRVGGVGEVEQVQGRVEADLKNPETH